MAGKPLQLIDFATAELRMEIEGEKPYSESSELRQFKESIGALLPWYKLWGAAFLGQLPKEQLARAIADAKSDSAKAGSTYREELFTFDEIVEVWIDVLLDVGGVDNVAIREIPLRSP